MAEMEGFDPQVFEKLEQFFFDDDFVASFEAWAKPHASLFGPDVSIGSEQKLEWMPLYQEFMELMEGKLEAFVTSQGLEMPVFMEACKRELLKGEGEDWTKKSPYGFILRVIQASAEYEMFLQMMVEIVAKAAEDAGSAE